MVRYRLFWRALTAALLVALIQPALAQDRTLIAEGDYAARKADGDKVLAHWKFWRLSTGEYEAVESSAHDPAITQTFRFDAKFLPTGYSLEFAPPKTLTDEHRTAGALPKPMSVSCEYKPQELRCNGDYDGFHSVASTPAKAPFVFFPGEFYALDFTWFLTGAVHLLERDDSPESVVNVYMMTSDKTNPDQIAVKEDRPIRLDFIGEENALVMGNTQRMRKYGQWPSELSRLWVTSKGLVALVGPDMGPTIGFGISNYVEHDPWDSPFHPVRRASLPPEREASSNQTTGGSGSAERVKISSGVATGLLLRKVQPVYPESAKKDHIQGTVVLHAVIGKDGHIIDLKPVSGPAELTAAAMTAVQQWEYRPFHLSGQPAEVETTIPVDFSLSH